MRKFVWDMYSKLVEISVKHILVEVLVWKSIMLLLHSVRKLSSSLNFVTLTRKKPWESASTVVHRNASWTCKTITWLLSAEPEHRLVSAIYDHATKDLRVQLAASRKEIMNKGDIVPFRRAHADQTVPYQI